MDREYWYWINNIPGIGNAKIRELLANFGTPEEVFKVSREVLEEIPILHMTDIDNICDTNRKSKIKETYNKALDLGSKFIFPYEDEYPKRLLELYDKPYILYYKGKLPEEYRKSVAIVGSRRSSEYGRHVARELGRVLSKAGVNIISGMAHGIDSEAHLGAVMSGNETFAILAGGVEKCYPPENFNLYMDILNQGGIISEYPPDTATKPGLFPLRNRIISGLSDAVIVVEAGHRSGSLITASMALEQNRIVYAVPGRIDDPTGVGCNELIAAGAMVVTGYEDLLRDLGLEENAKCDQGINNSALATDEKMLYSLLLDFTPRSLETLVALSKLDVSLVLKALIGLEMKGFIREISKNFYARV